MSSTDRPRRDVLKLAAGALAGAAASAFPTNSASAGQLHAPVSMPHAPGSMDRRRAAYDTRVAAARAQQRRRAGPSTANGDEQRYPSRFASYGKGLPHGANGEVDPRAFAALVTALLSGDARAIESVPVPGPIRLVNPCASFAFNLEGADGHALAIETPPTFASDTQAAEACELYWQALTRDVPFAEYGSHPVIGDACRELSNFEAFRGPRAAQSVTPATIFRGSTAGDLVGPYVSQFLLKEFSFGAIRLVQHVRTDTAGLDYLTDWDDWLAVQRGAAVVARHAGPYRHIRTARDLAAYVQLDFSYQPFLTACLILIEMEGTTDVRRPYKGAPYDGSNPYRSSKNQSGFSTFGAPHALDLVARVANLALRHAWYHKWLVHRRLRPEEYAARVHAHRSGRTHYPLHASILDSIAAETVFDRRKSYLLPQGFPEGAPMHPSFPSGHATIAGACATVLKAFFDESFPIEEPVVPSADGRTLQPYAGQTLTVGNELDKLASNIGMGRNSAGIHWRSDNEAGMRLGEAVALDLLAEVRSCLAERTAAFSVRTFDGELVTV
jgi:membrane-associated phospholipid phosphatase